MDRKNILIGSSIALLAFTGVGLYFYLSSSEEEGEVKYQSKEEILDKLDEELKGIVKPEKISAEQNGAQSKSTLLQEKKLMSP